MLREPKQSRKGGAVGTEAQGGQKSPSEKLAWADVKIKKNIGFLKKNILD